MKVIALFISFLFICLAKANSQSYFKKLERTEVKENKIVYWNYGLPDFEKMFAKEKVTKHFGFYFNQVAGCTIDERSVDEIKKHNRKIDKILSGKIGVEWKKIVYDAVDSVYTIDTILLSNTYIDKEVLDAILKIYDETKEPFEFRVTPTADPTIFFIDAFLIDKQDWTVTNRSILKIRATYPDISYKIVKDIPGDGLQITSLSQGNYP